MRLQRSLAVVTSALLAGGCTATSGHGKGSSSPTTSSTATPSSTSTTPPPAAFPTPSSTISATSTAQAWTKAVAYQHATAIVGAVSAALTSLSHVSPNVTLVDAQRALNALASADELALKDLASGAWPQAVRPKVNAYIAALDAERKTMRELVAKNSVTAMQQDATQVSTVLTEVQSAAQALTAALK